MELHLHKPGDLTHSLVYIREERPPPGRSKVPQMKIKYLLINLSCKLDNLYCRGFPSQLPLSGLTHIRTGGVASLRALLLHD